MEQSHQLLESEPKASKGRSIDIRIIVNKFISLWPWALLCAALMFAAAYSYVYFLKPAYHVNASILIKNNNSNSGQLNTLESLGLASQSRNIDNEKFIIRSYPLLFEVVHDMQLNVRYFKQDGLKDKELYGQTVPFKFIFEGFNADTLKSKGRVVYHIAIKKDKTGLKINNEANGRSWKISWYDTLSLPVGNLVIVPNHAFIGSNSEEQPFTVVVSNPEIAVSSLLSSFLVSVPDPRASILRLTLNTHVPKKGEDVLNHLIQTYIHANIEDNNRMADSTMAFIDRRMLIVGEQLSDIERRIQTFKQRNDIADITAQSQALIASTNTYAQKLAAKQVQLSVIDALQEYILKNKNNPRIVPAALMVESSTLSGIISQYNELLLQRSRLLLNATKDNPVVKNMDEQIVNLRQDLIKGIANVERSTKVTIRAMKEQQGEVQAQIHQVPKKERLFRDISRKQDVRQQLYLFLLKTREETAISKSSTVSNARIVNYAKTAGGPYSPNKRQIILIAVIIGACLPFGLTYARDMLNTKILSKQDIEKETDIPIVGEIGHYNGGTLEVIDSTNARSVISEQFRTLRTNLQFLLTNKDDKVVLITSSMGGEGKSSIAINLAHLLAASGKKVVLLELDLRKPKIVKNLNLETNAGFSSYVIGKAQVNDIIYPSGIDDDFFVLPAGPIPPNPSELLMHQRTNQLIKQLRDDFDYVLIDTAPVLVADPQILGQYVDVTLYLARMGITRRDQLRIPNDLVEHKKLPNLNIVVNDVKQKRYGGGYYGYGDRYVYGSYGQYVEGKK